MSLLGARILVTRSGRDWDQLEARVASGGGRIDFRPPTRTFPPSDSGPSQAAVDGIDRFDWIVFGSARGVGALADALERRGYGPAELRSRAACVGPATARAARGRGFDPAIVAEEGNAADLAGRLAGELTPGARVLVVRPEVGSAFPVETLVRAGAELSSVPFYATRPTPEAGAIADDLVRGNYDAVVVTAPSAIDALTAGALRGLRRVAIGATTARALARAGVPADVVAASPTPEGVADALESLC